MNPSLRNFYCKTYKAWDRLHQRDSITHVDPDEPTVGGLDGQWPCPHGEGPDDCCPLHSEGNHRDECIRCEICEPQVYNGEVCEETQSPTQAASEASSEEEYEGPGAPPRRT